MNTLQKLKVEQLALEYMFSENTEIEMYDFLNKYFNEDKDEIDELLVWRKEDKEYFKKELKRLLELVERS